jgi:hypothetical protein
MKKIILTLLIGLLTAYSPCILNAAQKNTKDTVVTTESNIGATTETEMDYSYGAVTSITAKKIIIKEYDYENDTEIDIEYLLDPKLELYNIDAIENIDAGDIAVVDFVLDGDNKIAKILTVEKTEKE